MVKKTFKGGLDLSMKFKLILFGFLFFWGGQLTQAVSPPALSVDILDKDEKKVGRANIYFNFLEIFDNTERKVGVIGVVMVKGAYRLYMVGKDKDRSMVGWAKKNRLHDAKGELIGYYQWTPIWSYIYDKDLKKLGKAQCLAYQGVCAAAVAGYLSGLYK